MPVYTARGKLSQGRLVELSTPLPVESAEVEVVISIPSPELASDWRESLRHIWASLQAARHQASPPSEIEATLKALRADRDVRNESLP